VGRWILLCICEHTRTHASEGSEQQLGMAVATRNEVMKSQVAILLYRKIDEYLCRYVHSMLLQSSMLSGGREFQWEFSREPKNSQVLIGNSSSEGKSVKQVTHPMLFAPYKINKKQTSHSRLRLVSLSLQSYSCQLYVFSVFLTEQVLWTTPFCCSTQEQLQFLLYYYNLWHRCLKSAFPFLILFDHKNAGSGKH